MPALKLPPASIDATDDLRWIGFTTLLLVAILSVAYRPAVDALLDAWSAISIQADGQTLAGVALAGFSAQLVDGAIGMGYGLTSSTVLVAAGLTPVTASACVHLAQLGTTLVSGLAHHRCGTVDYPTTWRIALPGVLGALVGASLLSSLPVKAAKTMASALLLAVGAYLLARFCRPRVCTSDKHTQPKLAFLAPVGILGGFVDVAGGGGWGPVATTALLAEGRLPPSKAVGTVSLSEFFVTVAAVIGFALGSPTTTTTTTTAASHAGVRLDLTFTLLIGGLLAAPLAPRLVTKLRPQLLGVVIGGFICLTNGRVLLKACGASAGASAATLMMILVVSACATMQVLRGQADGDSTGLSE